MINAALEQPARRRDLRHRGMVVALGADQLQRRIDHSIAVGLARGHGAIYGLKATQMQNADESAS